LNLETIENPALKGAGFLTFEAPLPKSGAPIGAKRLNMLAFRCVSVLNNMLGISGGQDRFDAA